VASTEPTVGNNSSSNDSVAENSSLPGSVVKFTGTPTIDKESSNSTASVVRFVPFPHNKFGYGNDAFCDWKTLSSNDPIVPSLLGSQAPDQIQKAALRESICVPGSTTLLSKLHLFSTEQAKSCLSNITLMVAGDSYNKQLLIRLSDIVLGNASNDEM